MWRIYWHIWMPLSRATIAAVAIFTFVHAWNNFLWPFVVTSAGSLFTIPVGLATVQTSYGALYAQQMAIAVMGALPLMIAFVLFQRQIVQGIANTGLRGRPRLGCDRRIRPLAARSSSVSAGGYLGADAGAARRGALHLEAAVERLEPVRQPAQARAEGRVRAADAVVGDDDGGRARWSGGC